MLPNLGDLAPTGKFKSKVVGPNGCGSFGGVIVSVGNVRCEMILPIASALLSASLLKDDLR